MEKLWGGRFSKPMDPKAFEFSSSLAVDQKLAKYDVEGSIAHVKMLGKTGIIEDEDRDKILKGLKSILKMIKSGSFKPNPRYEDIHTNIQALLEKKAGVVAGRLHAARSRNDQIALDARLYVREEAKVLISGIAKLQKAILGLCKKYSRVIIPGYTHLQSGQPVLFAHHLMAYLEMFERDKGRLAQAAERADELPLGAGALAGTTLPIDRKYVAKLLSFSKIASNSIDAVSARDFVIEILGALAILAMHCSRLCEDLILWSSREFDFIEIDERFSTGSSLMPQKKNPDILELIRGKTGRIYGNLLSLLVTMKSLPLAYNRDMQEDKTPMFDSIETTIGSLEVFSRLFGAIKVNLERVKAASSDELMMATDLAEYLIKKKVASLRAQQIVGKVVSYCIAKRKKLSGLSLGEMKSFSNKFGEDVFKLFSPQASVNAKRSLGATNPSQVKSALARWGKLLKNTNKLGR